jgi:drug/metabolite transporter (DMT)-like permease
MTAASASARANLRGMALMTLAMVGFAFEDAMIKAAAGRLPAGQVMLTIAVFSLPVFAVWARGVRFWPPGAARGPVLLRTLAEIVATCGILLALAGADLSTVTVIIQASPLFIVAAAALVLRETVGWRRWLAVAAGFAGVLVIVRPGAEGVEPGVLWAVMGAAGLCVRDLAARRIDPRLPTSTVAICGYSGVTLLSLVLLVLQGGPVVPDGPAWGAMATGAAVGILAYWAIIEATRAGDVSAITPFRYTRLLFGIGLGVVLFGEALDGATLLGAAMILGAGLYALYRERLRALEARQPVTANTARFNARVNAPEGRP